MQRTVRGSSESVFLEPEEELRSQENSSGGLGPMSRRPGPVEAVGCGQAAVCGIGVSHGRESSVLSPGFPPTEAIGYLTGLGLSEKPFSVVLVVPVCGLRNPQ